MANNCLVTKLNGVINDDSMDVLDYFNFEVVPNEIPTSASRYLSYMAKDSNPFTISVTGDNQLQFPYGTNIGSSRTTQGTGNVDIYLPNAKCRLLVPKYRINRIVVNANLRCDVSKVNYSSLINIVGNGWYGDLKEVEHADIDTIDFSGNTQVKVSYDDAARFTALTSLNLNHAMTVGGPLKKLGTLTSLTTLSVVNATGSIEDFVAIQVINSRTSCEGITTTGLTAYHTAYNNHVSFIGEEVNVTTAKNTLSWTYSSGQVTITYAGQSTTILVSSNGTWTRVS